MASTRRQRSGLRGVGKLRRTLRRLGPDATAEVRTAVKRGADFILADMQTLVPKDTGDLARALDTRIARDGLTARVGLVTPKKQRDFFYARFLELPSVRAAQGMQPFMQPAFDLNRGMILRETQTAIRQVLRRAASGPIGD